MRPYVCGTRWLIAAALIVASGSMAFGQEERSGTRFATCIVRITSDRDVLPVSPDMIDSLLESTPVLGEPLHEILGLATDSVPKDVAVSFEGLDQSVSQMGSVLIGRVCVQVRRDEAKPLAEELLAAICERLEQALQQVGTLDAKRFQQRLADIEAELVQLDEQYEQIRVARRELLDQAGRDDLSRARIADTINELEDTRQTIELSLAGAQAREAALTEQIAKIGQQAIEAAEKSAVVDELRQIVDIRKMELARAQQLHETGQASQADLNGAQEALARARADLARYRESVSKTAGAELLAQLNHELVSLSVESAQQEAQLVAVQQRLALIRDKQLLELADRYEREVELQLALSERAVRALTEEQFELKQTIRNLRLPEVVVIGG